MEYSKEIIGIVTIILIQGGQTLRSWLTNKKNKSIKDNVDTLKTKFEVLLRAVTKIKEKVEHTNFIPSFEIDFNNYIIRTIESYKKHFKNYCVRDFLLAGSMEAREIFIKALKLGFENKSFIQNIEFDFKLKEISLRSTFRTKDLSVDKDKIESIIQTEKTTYLHCLNELITDATKSNGIRQSEFKELCESFIHNIIKRTSTL